MSDSISEALGLPPIDINYDEGTVEWDPYFLSKEAKKRNATVLTCDKCGTTGNLGNMRRWHFENCRTVLKNCLHCKKLIPPVKPLIVYEKKLHCNKQCYFAWKVGKPAIVRS